MRVPYIFYRNFYSMRSFGVEMEVNNNFRKKKVADILRSVTPKQTCVTGYVQSQRNRYWHIKEDSSCGIVGPGSDWGWEIASYKASGIKDLLHICHIADVMRVEGVQVNENCGLHVHVGIEDFSLTDVGLLIAIWLRIESYILQSVPDHRIDNEFCYPLFKQLVEERSANFEQCVESLRNGLDIWHFFKPEDLSLFGNAYKSVTMNMVNYARSMQYKTFNRKTVEFRFPEGTLSGFEIKNWVRLFVNFVQNCKDYLIPWLKSAFSEIKGSVLSYITGEDMTLDELLFTLGLKAVYNDEFFLLSPGLFETKTWILERILNYSEVRKIRKETAESLNFMWKPARNYYI